MPRIKITALPKKSKLRKFWPGGPFGSEENECPEGQMKDEFGNCVPDFNYQPAQQGFSTGQNNASLNNQSTGSGNMWSNLASNVSNIANENARKTQGLMNSSSYNPFDVKWGQPQNSPLPDDYISDDYKRMMGQLPNSKGATRTGMNNQKGDGTLNTSQLTTDYPNSSKEKEKKNKPGFWGGLHKFNQGVDKVASIAYAGLGYLDNLKTQNEFNLKQQDAFDPVNYYGVNTNIDKGDYMNGMFRPNILGYKSKGMQANPIYAQQTYTGEYGGVMPYAAEGMLVAGDTNVQKAFLSGPAPLNIPNFDAMMAVGAEPKATKVETAAPKSSTATINLKGKDVATKTNNPGNILFTPTMAKLFGAVDSGIKQTDGNGHFALFPDVETGLKARETQLFGEVDGTFKSRYYKPNTTVDEALRKWSNNGYNGSLYPKIANKTLAEVTPEERRELMKRQIKMESGSMYRQLKEAGVFANGGQNNKNMKIRIVGLPNENQEMAKGGQPQYSGQTDYGLYVGQRNLYRAMPQDPYDTPKNTVSEEEETPDNPHVLEAEGKGKNKAGETILRPDDTHMNIVGPTHAEGGVKLTKKQAPEGSFIFSNTKKMKIKDPAVLKNFGKGGTKALTPAEIAKQYDTNKFLAILADPNADILQKQTAMAMIANYKRKLGELGLVQEGMKGFPQGIPDISKELISSKQGVKLPKQSEEEGETQPDDETKEVETAFGRLGGFLRKADNGTIVPPAYQDNPNFIGPSPTGALTLWPGDKYQNKKNKSIYPQSEWVKKLQAKGYRGNYTPEDVQRWIYSKPEGKAKVDELHDLHKGIIYGGPRENKYDAKIGYRWDAPLDAIPDIVPDDYNYENIEDDKEDVIDDETTTTTTGGNDDKGTTDMSETTIGTDGEPCPDGYTWDNVYKKCRPIGSVIEQQFGRGPRWTSQDTRDYFNSLVDYGTIKKYHPRSTKITGVLPEFIGVDPTGYANMLQAGANTAAEQLNTYNPGSAVASNLSFLAGQQQNALADYMQKADQWNAAGAAAKDSERADILNKFTQYNAGKVDQDYEEENTFDDRYRAAERLGRKGVVKAANAGEDTASKIFNENITRKYFKVDPWTQQVVFNSDNARAAWEKETSGGYEDPQARQKMIADAYNYFYDQARGDADTKARVAATNLSVLFPDAGSSVTTQKFPNNPKKDNTKEKKNIEKYGGNTGYSYYNPFF